MLTEQYINYIDMAFVLEYFKGYYKKEVHNMVEVLRIISQEIEGVLEQVGEQDMQKALSCLDKNKRIFVVGEGRSGLMAKGFAMRLMHLGFTVFVVGETITPAITAKDVMVAVSGSGKSAGVVLDAQKAKKLGAAVLAVSSNDQNPLTETADVALIVPGTVKADSGEKRGSVQLLSSLFDQCLHIVLDALCLMASRRDETSNEAATGAHW